jgi:hypothetical protein
MASFVKSTSRKQKHHKWIKLLPLAGISGLIKGGQLLLLRSCHFRQNRNTMLSYTPVISFSESFSSRHGDYIAPDASFIVCEAANDYQPRNPENTLLYGIVSENLETFLSRQAERGRSVPRFVERKLRSFLDCGVLARGFCSGCPLEITNCAI